MQAFLETADVETDDSINHQVILQFSRAHFISLSVHCTAWSDDLQPPAGIDARRASCGRALSHRTNDI